MSDPLDPKPSPPLQARPSQRRPQGQPRRAAPPSRESRFVGYLVLGLGILAVMTVALLAFGGPGVDTDEKAPDAAVSASLQSGLSTDMRDARQNRQAETLPQLAMPRQKGIDSNDLAGGWQTSIGPYVAVLQMQKGAFQIMLAQADPAFARKYSTGTYTMVDDIVVLKPRLDWEPKATAGSGVRYERLTAGSYPMIVGFKNGAMVWQNTPQTEKRMYVPSRSPLLLDPAKDYIVWKKVE